METRLQRVLFSITVNQGSDAFSHASAPTAVDDILAGTPSAIVSVAGTTDNVSYNELRRMIGDMGGSVSATVHKKVDFVVASAGAVGAATQRLRKAEKFQVPVVKVKYIIDLFAGVAKPDEVANYLYSADEVISSIAAYKESSIQSPSEASRSSRREGGGSCGGGVGECSEMSCDRPARKKRRVDAAGSGTPRIMMTSSSASRDSGETFDCSCICHDRGESSCGWCVGAHSGVEAGGATSTCSEETYSQVKKKKQQKKKEKKKEKREKS